MRYGYAIRMGGDPEISGALEAGIRAATRQEMHKGGSDAVRRVAMMRHTPQEWAQMIEDARADYGRRPWLPRWATPLLVGYALICYGVSMGWRALMQSLGM